MSTNAHTPTPPSHMAELCLPNPKRTSVQPYTHDRKASVATVSSGWMMPPGSALVNMKGHKYHESWTGTPVGTPTHQTAFPRQAPSPFFAPQASGTPWPQRTSGESRHQRSSSIDAHSDGHLNIVSPPINCCIRTCHSLADHILTIRLEIEVPVASASLPSRELQALGTRARSRHGHRARPNPAPPNHGLGHDHS